MPRDRCANYNAFGRDPNGRVAYLASFFYGPDYVPAITLQQFGGPPEPPRYGPPARYQLACLPPGFQPRRPPNFLDPEDPDGVPEPPYLDGPEVFDPRLFAAFEHVKRWKRYMPNDEFDSDSDSDNMDATSIISGSESNSGDETNETNKTNDIIAGNRASIQAEESHQESHQERHDTGKQTGTSDLWEHIEGDLWNAIEGGGERSEEEEGDTTWDENDENDEDEDEEYE
ncbi:hypothetical protein Hypma_009521 [Hypsizygus marmoreus]|uniref:Uncharacterized protein n=1 Tax=Hypsizygus marmoreus TaxID=39966 RepID=A0A369JP33_HYPMA|nr:hypothetical protein Hypma_009521 [Hypsizygus marmoreus]